jgi:hypothetical protein
MKTPLFHPRLARQVEKAKNRVSQLLQLRFNRVAWPRKAIALPRFPVLRLLTWPKRSQAMLARFRLFADSRIKPFERPLNPQSATPNPQLEGWL